MYTKVISITLDYNTLQGAIKRKIKATAVASLIAVAGLGIWSAQIVSAGECEGSKTINGVTISGSCYGAITTCEEIEISGDCDTVQEVLK